MRRRWRMACERLCWPAFGPSQIVSCLAQCHPLSATLRASQTSDDSWRTATWNSSDSLQSFWFVALVWSQFTTVDGRSQDLLFWAESESLQQNWWVFWAFLCVCGVWGYFFVCKTTRTERDAEADKTFDAAVFGVNLQLLAWKSSLKSSFSKVRSFY